MNQNGSPREDIVKKLNEIHDEPVFFLKKEEIEWILKDWIESQSKQKTNEVGLIFDDVGYGRSVFAEIEMSEQLVTQAT